jgi:hypothetical protein
MDPALIDLDEPTEVRTFDMRRFETSEDYATGA